MMPKCSKLSLCNTSIQNGCLLVSAAPLSIQLPDYELERQWRMARSWGPWTHMGNPEVPGFGPMKLQLLKLFREWTSWWKIIHSVCVCVSHSVTSTYKQTNFWKKNPHCIWIDWGNKNIRITKLLHWLLPPSVKDLCRSMPTTTGQGLASPADSQHSLLLHWWDHPFYLIAT